MLLGTKVTRGAFILPDNHTFTLTWHLPLQAIESSCDRDAGHETVPTSESILVEGSKVVQGPIMPSVGGCRVKPCRFLIAALHTPSILVTDAEKVLTVCILKHHAFSILYITSLLVLQVTMHNIPTRQHAVTHHCNTTHNTHHLSRIQHSSHNVTVNCTTSPPNSTL